MRSKYPVKKTPHFYATGTGKTVIILALILLTLDILPSANISLGDEQTIFTPLSVRRFPKHTALHSRISKGKTRSDIPFGPPTLVEILLHFIRVSPAGLGTTNYQQQLEQRNLWEPLLSNSPFHIAQEVDISEGDSSRRSKRCSKQKVMYLTIATLIIVPHNLLSQWQSEILKHFEVSLRVFILKNDTVLPPPQRLASDYDVSHICIRSFPLF